MMNTKLNLNHKSILLYTSMYVMSALICISIFINYKRQIVDEHINFLTAQIPDLQAENIYILKEIRIHAKKRASLRNEIKEFEPLLTYLFDETSNIREEHLINMNKFLKEEFKTPNLLDKAFEDLSPPSKEKLLTYRITSFQNKLITYLYQSKVGYTPYSMQPRNWSLVDFWSKGNYYNYLSYEPGNSLETPMTINGVKRNENAILFGPKRTGMHTFNISLSHFDEKGVEKKLNFTKEIEVLP